MKRRTFIKTLFGGSAAIVAAPLIAKIPNKDIFGHTVSLSEDGNIINTEKFDGILSELWIEDTHIDLAIKQNRIDLSNRDKETNEKITVYKEDGVTEKEVFHSIDDCLPRGVISFGDGSNPTGQGKIMYMHGSGDIKIGTRTPKRNLHATT